MDVKRFKNFMASAVSDALHGCSTMDPEIKSMVPGQILAGPAFTVKCYPGSIITVHRALLEAKPGDVLVIDGAGSKNGALMGELMALQCKTSGFAGVVIDGCCRDLRGLNELEYPFFARYVTPMVGNNRRLGSLQCDITCGGVVVHPGDWIMGDDDGVVVIPADKLEETVAKAEATEIEEAEIAKRLANGEKLADIDNMWPRLYPERFSGK
ncbi:MAG: RraA family protein [Eubacteriales bacterium]|nr:RraA family protein [Eubacteriales bacterium]